MKRCLTLFAVAFCLQSALVAPATALTQDEIAGTWTVVSIVHEEQSGKKNTPLGEHPKGVLVIGRDNRFTAVLVAEGRTPPQNEGGMAEMNQSVIAYSAVSTSEPDPNNPAGLKVTLRPDVSWNPVSTGNSDIRFITSDGSKLTIKSISAGGTETQIYQRVAK
jgi:Lipocalin-like domain